MPPEERKDGSQTRKLRPSTVGLWWSWVADCVRYKQGVLNGQQFQGSVMSITHKLNAIKRAGKQLGEATHIRLWSRRENIGSGWAEVKPEASKWWPSCPCLGEILLTAKVCHKSKAHLGSLAPHCWPEPPPPILLHHSLKRLGTTSKGQAQITCLL